MAIKTIELWDLFKELHSRQRGTVVAMVSNDIQGLCLTPERFNQDYIVIDTVKTFEYYVLARVRANNNFHIYKKDDGMYQRVNEIVIS